MNKSRWVHLFTHSVVQCNFDGLIAPEPKLKVHPELLFCCVISTHQIRTLRWRRHRHPPHLKSRSSFVTLRALPLGGHVLDPNLL